MPYVKPSFCLALALSISLASPAAGAEIDFAREIRPLLSDNCYHCHGPDENAREAELRLDTKEGLFRQQDGIAIVSPGDSGASELVRRLTSDDEFERMPPPDARRRLTPEQIALVRRWVEQGAVWEGHWSFQQIVAPAVPEAAAASFPESRPRNAIDYFVLERLARDSLRHNPPASRERLLRRVTLDLTGLPPTLEELDAFLQDDSPEAYERVVDRLLQSPHYGERMAWEWLDAARYADTNGFQGDNERTMWPWRDWVVNALNDNMPYDQFTIWQLAGDLLPEATFEQKLATGFCRNHMINGEGGRIPAENRVEYVFDQVETMTTVWMGLTLQCCRCHDHKFDPLARREYYELFAFFNQTPVDGSGGNPQTPPVIEAPTAEQRQLLAKSSEQITDSMRYLEELERELPKNADLPSKVKQFLAQAAARRNAKQWETLSQHFAASNADYSRAAAQIQLRVAERERIQAAIPRAMVMADMAEPRQTFMLTKGLYNQPDGEVTANVPAVFSRLPADSRADRLALARWLVDAAHPLTARVTVNRHWQLFFGTGLVKTPEDFGVQGERPSHPELLDWLAAELIRSGWDVKHLHKLIVMSATYQQSAKQNLQSPIPNPQSPPPQSLDPDNRLLARGPRSRMPSWMIRDHVLAASGLLVDRIGGPPVNPYQPPGVWSEATFGKKQYEQGHGGELYRRSLYTFWRRIVGPTMFFDESKRQTCEVKRGQTNTPLHALITMNDVTYVEAARALAERVMKTSDADAARIATAFRLATSRRPTEAETDILLARLGQLKSQYIAAPEQAKHLLAVGESPRDEALDAFEHAAYTGLCSLILNLDEALTR